MSRRRNANLERVSDERLMGYVRVGETAALTEIYERYSRRLLNYFEHMLGNGEAAQDFLQDLFIKVLEKASGFDENRRFETWLFAVASNMCKNEFRRRTARNCVETREDVDRLPVEVGQSDYHPIERRLDEKAFRKALNDELAELSDIHRSVFLLRHQEHFSTEEISRILNCAPGTVKSRLHYAVRALASRLKSVNPL